MLFLIFCHVTLLDVHSEQKRNQITLEIFIVKGLNKVFHACIMNHKQLMNMHLLNGRKDNNSLRAVGN